jgi:hypothetical protein
MAIAPARFRSQRTRNESEWMFLGYFWIMQTVERGMENRGRKTLGESLPRTAERTRQPKEEQPAMWFPLLKWCRGVPLGRPGK